jgi:uridine kinase
MLFVVAIAGGVGARKNLLAQELTRLLLSRYPLIGTTILSLEAYKIEGAKHVEEPSGLDMAGVIQAFDLLVEAADHAKENEKAIVADEGDLLVLFVEGVYAMLPEIRARSDLRIFIDTDADTRLSNTVLDKSAAGVALDQILTNWINEVKPSFDKYVSETKNHADVILPRGSSNEGGVATIGTFLLDAVARRFSQKSTLSASQTLISPAGVRSLRESDQIYYDSS